MIKGINSIQFLDSQLRNGVRSKEFLMVGTAESDRTPFDTDFSEINQENLKESNKINEIISTTVSSGYGSTYLVVKKSDYDKEKTYALGDRGSSTRYIRTGIGSTNISAVLTSEWQEDNAYSMAQNGIYIPVVDLNNNKVLFTPEQYNEIRAKMKGMSYYRADDFEIDENVENKLILAQAEEMREKAEKGISTKEKKKKIIKEVRQILPKIVVEDMIGDVSKKYIEFIDTGSTGRGTNIPGDGDFDFMLKCVNKDEQAKMIALLRKSFNGIEKGGANEYNIRQENVHIQGLETPVDIDVTSEKKSLQTEYSSDLCVRDRLNNIKANYGEEKCKQVVDNIIVAKKILKEKGIYKKSVSNGATEFGGFGGIGVENWILQNGGSFILAMENFLDNTRDKNGNKVDFNEFKRKYPIYDFGQNHREGTQNNGHDHYIEGLSDCGYEKMQNQFKSILKEFGINYKYDPKGHLVKPIESQKNKHQNFTDSIYEYTKEAEKYKRSDLSIIYSYIAKYKAEEQTIDYQEKAKNYVEEMYGKSR